MLIQQQLIWGGDYTYDEYFGLIPPESKTFEFPLYITVPFEDETSERINYVKYNDDIFKQLHTYCIENAELDYSSMGYEIWVVRNIPDIYINGKKVKDIQIDAFFGVFDAPRLFLNEMPFLNYECFIYDDNSITLTMYKYM